MALCIPVGVPSIFIIIRWSVCFPYLASTYVHARRSTHIVGRITDRVA